MANASEGHSADDLVIFFNLRAQRNCRCRAVVTDRWRGHSVDMVGIATLVLEQPVIQDRILDDCPLILTLDREGPTFISQSLGTWPSSAAVLWRSPRPAFSSAGTPYISLLHSPQELLYN